MKQKQTIEYKRALIYCRVSSARQVNEGDGLTSQEHRCYQKAQDLNLPVAEVFKDPAVSGGLFERPAMTRLINFLDKHPNEKFVVIFDDLKRFARDIQVHLLLKTELVKKRKVKLECLNFKFEESPTGRFIEVVMAAGAQLDREQNTEQVKNKMKARLEAGYWPFCPPPGLENRKHPTKGKILMPVEPYAGIYKAAIEKFRDYQLNTLEAVRVFILNEYTQRRITKPLSLNGTKRILSELLYTGYAEYEPWGIKRFEAQHEGFINYETHLAVMDKLANKAKPRLRKDYNADFPVRGYALCQDCQKPMTAGWFKGRNEREPYYLCKTIGCGRKNKTILRKDLESSFIKLLKQVQPQAEALKFIEAVLNDVWKNRSQQEQAMKNGIGRSISDLEQKNAALGVRVSQATNEAVITQYEKTIALNSDEITKLNAKLAKIKYPQTELQTALRVVLNFVGSPIKQWESKNYRRQRLLLGMYFENKLTYDPVFGFQTAQLPLILELSQQKNISKTHLVDTLRNSLNQLFDYTWRWLPWVMALENDNV